jgi:miniconductance mechanosensitive channel
MTWIDSLQSWLERMPIGAEHVKLISAAVGTLVVLLISVVAYMISRRIANRTVPRIVERTANTWDDVLAEKGVFRHLALMMPALVMQFFIPAVLADYPRVVTVIGRVLSIYLIIVTVLVIDALLNALHTIYQHFKVSQEIPLTGFVQVLKIVMYCLGLLLVISIVLDRTPLYLFSGLGAMTAVLMLVFKDPIMGFVSGLQLTGNRMLRQGDWIEMPKYNADGDVIDITLTTVKVRNWDKTITTIPTYALISDSFKNWRGMQESGGRRIKRAIYVDMSTIRFCTPQMLTRYAKIHYIADYIARKNQELDQHNAALGLAAQDMANLRRLTNIGTFRAYVQAYLLDHPMINTDMTFLVRQLEPCEHGLPLEIYVFCKDKAWANYEGVQADIFDHLLAIAPEFDLRVFQYPSGHDVSVFGNRLSEGKPVPTTH